MTSNISSPTGFSCVQSRGALIDRVERGLRRRLAVLHAPEAVGRLPLERRLRIEVGEHVARLVPAASQDEPAGARRGPAPFLHVAGHVVGAERAEPLILTDRRGALPAEVAGDENVGEVAEAGRVVPMKGRRADSCLRTPRTPRPRTSSRRQPDSRPAPPDRCRAPMWQARAVRWHRGTPPSLLPTTASARPT